MSNTQAKTIENGSGSVTVMENVDQETGEIVSIETPGIGQAISTIDSEINQQIATARRYPRNVTEFRKKVLALCTLNEVVAKECIYAVPRGGKVIEGPSVRFAEIVQMAWGNCRVGGRIIADDGKFIIAQGAFHDLESNSAVNMEALRRITDKYGKRYNDDMIAVTGSAAIAIATRNAVLKAIPKALWNDLYESSRKTVLGDFKTLANKRASALQSFVPYGVEPAQIYAVLGVKGEHDLTPDHLIQLFGILNALKDGSTTPEEIFPKKDVPGTRPEKPAADATGEAKPKTARKAATKKDEPKPQDGVGADTKAAGASPEEPKQDAPAADPTKPAEATVAETKPEEPEGDKPPSADLTRFLTGIVTASSAEEIGGIRSVAKAELTGREFGIFQAEALRIEQNLAKGRK